MSEAPRSLSDSAPVEVQVARMAERVHTLAGKMQETNATLRDMSGAITQITRDFSTQLAAQADRFSEALAKQSERFLTAQKEQGERHERELSTLHTQITDIANNYVRKGEISSTWQIAQAVAKIVGWLVVAGALVFATRQGILR